MANFKKFSNPEPKGAKKKEMIRQDKRQERAERQAWYDQKKKQQKADRVAGKEAADAPQGKAPQPKADKPFKKPLHSGKALDEKKSEAPASKPAATVSKKKDESEAQMPLNKYVAHAGVCSRRDAAILVKEGKVKVNGQVNTEPGYKVQRNDTVVVNGKKVERQEKLVYILMNKPKDFLTTAEDEKGRKTVLDLVKNHVTERVYPVGRLDRNTTGILLLTNDGDLAQQLSHPKFEIKKIYEAKLDKAITKADLEQLTKGITLEDGFIAADSAAYADPADKTVVGIELHSGRNRIVRRMFEHLGYDVKHLDRVMFANLTKKNVERGKWRFLSDKEVRLLKYFQKSKGKH